MGYRAHSHSKLPCPGMRGSAWVDRTLPLLLVGTLMNYFSNTNSKNNSSTSQWTRRIYSDSGRTRSQHQSWGNRNRAADGYYSDRLDDFQQSGGDNFNMADIENDLLRRRALSGALSSRQMTTPSSYSGALSEELRKQHFLNNFISWGPQGPSASCDLTLLRVRETAEPSFPSIKDQRLCGLLENSDLRRQEGSDELSQINPFSRVTSQPFPKPDDKDDYSYARSATLSSVKNAAEERSGKPEPEQIEDNSILPTFRFMKIKKRLGICSANHPAICLTTDQLKAVKREILEKIFETEGVRVRPRFFGTGIKNGYLVLVCGDYTTVSWVKELIPKLRAPGGGGGRLQVVEEPYDNKTFIAVGHFPQSDGDSNVRILKLLEIQNEGLDVSKWKILNKEYERNSAVRMTFSIDWVSASKLKSRGPLLNYKFGGARFLLKTKRGIKFKHEDVEDDNDASHDCCDDFPLTVTHFPNPLAASRELEIKSDCFITQDDYQISFPAGKEREEYRQRVAAIVKKSKNSLRYGLTSKERFLMRKQNKRKKRKKKQIKVEPL